MVQNRKLDFNSENSSLACKKHDEKKKKRNVFVIEKQQPKHHYHLNTSVPLNVQSIVNIDVGAFFILHYLCLLFANGNAFFYSNFFLRFRSNLFEDNEKWKENSWRQKINLNLYGENKMANYFMKLTLQLSQAKTHTQVLRCFLLCPSQLVGQHGVHSDFRFYSLWNHKFENGLKIHKHITSKFSHDKRILHFATW